MPHSIDGATVGQWESAALLAATLFAIPCAVIRIEAHVLDAFSSVAGRTTAASDPAFYCSTPGYEVDDAGWLVRRGADPAAARHPGGGAEALAAFASCPLAGKDGQALGALLLFDTASRGPLSADERDLIAPLVALIAGCVEGRFVFRFRDPLTGLGNRAQFVHDARRALSSPPPSGAERWAVMIDVFPIESISRLVVAVGLPRVERAVERMSARVIVSLPRQCKVYRLGLARFGFLFDGRQDDACRLARDCVAYFDNPISVDDDLPLNLSAHASVMPVRADTVPELIGGLFAMAESARELGVPVHVFDPRLMARQRRHVLIINALRGAVAAPDQLRLVYQPRERLRDGQWTSVETLVRWQHPVLGDISPAEFIPILENTPLMPLLTDWVLEHALHQLAVWHRVAPELKMSINIAACDLKRSDFGISLRRAMQAHGIPGRRIELELTEGKLLQMDAVAAEALASLAQCGVEIALDDFGAGYSNLSQLSQLSYDVLKLDNALVRSVCSNPRAALIVKTVVGLAKQLGYRVVAEGIETAALRALSAQWGCDEAQGYFIARPMEARVFSEHLARCAMPLADGTR